MWLPGSRLRVAFRTAAGLTFFTRCLRDEHFCVSADPASEKREKETENAEMGSGNSQAELRAAGWEISQTKAEREQSTAAAFSSCVSTVQEPEWEITDIYLFC